MVATIPSKPLDPQDRFDVAGIVSVGGRHLLLLERATSFHGLAEFHRLLLSRF